jgi:hypothetical protein
VSITTDVVIKIGDLEVPGVQAPVDFTDRATGFSSRLRADIGEVGSASCTITLDNNDGELTPGGGGTYSSWDWHSKGVFISATVGSHTPTIFHGLVTDFRLDDDGIDSFVQIVAQDFMTVGGRAIQRQEISTGLGFAFPMFVYEAISYTFQRVLVDFGGGNKLDFSGTPLPQWGLPFTSVYPADTSPLTLSDTLEPYLVGEERTASDWLVTSIMPTGPSVAWPTTIYAFGPTFPVPRYTTVRYEFVALASKLITGTRYTYKFAENTASGELPFRNLQRGWNVDDLVTKVKIDGVAANGFGGTITASATATNTQAEELYGERAMSFTDIALGDNTVAGLTTQEQVDEIAQRYVNARSQSKFVVQSLQVTSKMCDSHVGGSSASEQMWAELLDVSSGMWQVSTVEFTPAGTSTTITEPVVIWARQIDATPEDVRVTLSFYPIQYTCAFLLDDPILGVLGGTLDTYDTGSFTYDAGLLRYNGRPEYGMTLG